MAEKSDEEVIESIGGPLKKIGKPFTTGGKGSLPLTQLIRAVLPFQRIENTFFAQPQLPFKPKGLIIWGAPNFALVDVKIGMNLQGVVAWGGIPAAWFATGSSYEQILAKLEAGIQAPDWMTYDLCDVGVSVQVTVYLKSLFFGPDDGVDLLMWGETFRGASL